ncbi:MAG: aldehyde ferredoxin oxidoreductase [Candidatus Lokiarchaeota archaeon]|nr:aldehyde ferredoxin oxidoreductase [Candidatus Lokiarchaeota archaeon]
MDFKILRVNMNNLSSKWENLPSEFETFAGRALTSAIIAKEVDPTCDPLKEKNKIVIAPGLLAGTTAPSSGRLSVGGKSPLTGGIKEANAGGITAGKLARLGIRAIIIEGMPPKDKKDWYSIIVKKGACEIKKTNNYANMGLYDLIKKIWDEYPSNPGIIGCGIAGQRLNLCAGVFGNNIENSDPGRYAGRGGLGAVFGSKRIIAVITDDSDGQKPEIKNNEKYEDGRKKFVDALRKHPVTGDLKDANGNPYGGLKNFGTNVLMNVLNEAGGLPTRNFSSDRFEGAAKISGEAIHELVDKTIENIGEKSQGTYGHPCHPGCLIACSNVVPYENNGQHHVGCLEYESAWALGATCGIDVLKDVAELNRLCNDLGLDTIEAGNTIAMFMEAGIINFGDGSAAINLLKEAYNKNSITGRLVCSGALIAGKSLGVTRIPVVKGQSLPAYDPRPIKGIGVTYATTPMGADHTAGYTIAAEIFGIKGQISDPRSIQKSELSLNFQATTAFIDSTGYCLFIAFCILDDDDGFSSMLDTVQGFLGTEIDPGVYGMNILKIERDFNKRAGFSEKDDRLPEFFYTEKVAPHNVVFDVSDEELDKVYEKL